MELQLLVQRIERTLLEATTVNPQWSVLGAKTFFVVRNASGSSVVVEEMLSCVESLWLKIVLYSLCSHINSRVPQSDLNLSDFYSCTTELSTDISSFSHYLIIISIRKPDQ